MDAVPKTAVERTVNPIDFLTEAERTTLTGRAVDMRDAVMLHVPMDDAHARHLQAILLAELALTLLRQRGVNEVKERLRENRPLPVPPVPTGMPAGGMERITDAARNLVRLAKAAELDVQECQGSKVPDVRGYCNAIAELAAAIPAFAGGSKLRIES